MEDKRLNPEKLLQRAQAEALKEKHGKLKIYLGAAPGVGKTYEMLHDALAEQAKGLDVVVGVVESHGRGEIESMLKDFEVLPRQIIDYRGKQLLEFDFDAALKRHPGLILIDEMAHTNASNLRHAKRWQDIKEFLDRGIDVYTTLNVQHIESLNDDIAQIIHAPIKETVPDSMIEIADTIELIDIPPDELLKRLQEGKVYIPEQATLAAEHFFRKGNLIALRELALRVTAERVGAEVLLYRQGEGITHIWPIKDKILVCVDPKPESIKLIRAAKRIANSLQAEWIAIYIDTPQLQSSEIRNNAIQNLHLAEQLGADTRVLTGFDIVKEIMNFAREQNVTQIMIWKHIRKHWQDWFHRNLADELVRHSDEIDVYIMTGVPSEVKPKKNLSLAHPIPWKVYLIAIGIVTLTTMINVLLYPFLAASNLIMVYLLGVTIVALFGRTGPSILASIFSVLAYDFFFTPPFYSFAVSDIEYVFTFIVMLLVTQVISHLTILIRNQAETARLIQHQTSVLYTLSRQLSSTRGIDKLLQTGIQFIANNFDSNVLVLLPVNNHLEIHGKFNAEQTIDIKEQGIAQWVYELGQIAGFGTDTLTFSKALYLPLLTSHGTIGVLRVLPKNQQLFTPEQMRSLEACANQIALALEVDHLQDIMNKSALHTETNRVRNDLLQTFSHDLRAPLISIIGFASTQIEMAKELKTNEIEKLGRSIYSESEQLSRLINNILQITYLESGSIKLQKQLASLKDTITTVVKMLSQKLGERPLHINVSKDLPNIPFDVTLIQEVFINLIDNAIKFSEDNTPIDITVVLDKENLIVNIEDRGPGIVPDEKDKLFEKFYRGRQITTERGLGLGLAICREIIKAHGGKIWAENRVDDGASFCFTLPLHSQGDENA